MNGKIIIRNRTLKNYKSLTMPKTTESELTSNLLDALLPTLTQTDREIILLTETGINTDASRECFLSEHGISISTFKTQQHIIRRHMNRVRDACDRLNFAIDAIRTNTLDAPIEVLNIFRRTENLLKRRGYKIQRISDLYRDKYTIDFLWNIRDIKDKRINNINDALGQIGLPRLSKSQTDSLVYRFHDPEYASRLSVQESLLLKAKHWSMMSVDEISRKHAVSVGEMLDIVKKAEEKLMEK